MLDSFNTFSFDYTIKRNGDGNLGKFFDEISVDEEFITPSRTITETDVVMFAALSGDYNELHTSEEYMKTSQFGKRIVHGLLILAISHGLMFRLGLFDGTGIAFLEVESWKFKAPVFFGDTIHVRVKVKEKRLSRSNPDRGIVKFLVEVIKADGTVVQEGAKVIMLKCKSQREIERRSLKKPVRDT